MNFLIYLLLNLAVLTLAAWLSHGRRWSVFLALLAFGFGVGMFTNLIEAVVFAVMPLEEALAAAASAFPVFALFALAAMLVSGKWSAPVMEAARPNVTAGRLVLIVLAYELLYFTAGTWVFPHVADFYATRRLPPVELVLSLQVVRSLLFVAWSWPLLRLAPRHAPWLFGLGFAVIGGLAPLVVDNPYMPAEVRFYHAIETGVSNFLFGLILGWLLGPRKDGPDQVRALPESA